MSKLVETMNINTVPKYIKAMTVLNLDNVWSIVFYKVLLDGVSYEEAGKPFKITKHAVYERLKIAKKQLGK